MPSDRTQRVVFVAIGCAFFVAGASIVARSIVKPTAETLPVPLGTNGLEIGANLYDGSNNYHFGEIVELDRWHEFPDGTIRSGALLRATNGNETWIPMERMSKMLVNE